MRIVLATLLAATAIATPLVAQQMPGSKDKAAITGGSYTVDANHTLVKWEVNHFGFSPLWGLFGQVTGTMQFDPKNPAASKVDVTIPVSKMVTGVPGFTAHLLRDGKDGGKPDFFGSAPADAKFVSTHVMVDADGDEADKGGHDAGEEGTATRSFGRSRHTIPVAGACRHRRRARRRKRSCRCLRRCWPRRRHYPVRCWWRCRDHYGGRRRARRGGPLWWCSLSLTKSQC